jgi:hypothetical protein
LTFGEATKFSAKSKRRIVERISDAISNIRSLIELSEIAINVEKLRDTPKAAYPDFLNTKKTSKQQHLFIFLKDMKNYCIKRDYYRIER